MPAPLASITACGAYVPKLRLARSTIASAVAWANPSATAQAKGERAVVSWDEDAVTLAVEAARQCDAAAIDSVTVASTTLPFADRSNASILATALDLPESIATRDCTGSLRAGTGALIDAATSTRGRSLVVLTDGRKTRVGSAAELSYGDGAAALVVEPAQADSLADVLAVERLSANFVDHYRGSDSDFDYALEERWVREAGVTEFAPRTIRAALERAAVSANAVTHFVMPGAAHVAQRVAKAAGLERAQVANNLHESVGDTGVAHPALMLVGALERATAGDLLVLCMFGQGCDVLVLRVGARRLAHTPLASTLARRAEEKSYVRYLSHAALVEVDFGMRAERDHRTAHTVAWRKSRTVTAFVGGKCQQCGTVQFPPARVCVNPSCRATDTQAPYRLAASTGKVKTFTEDWQAYSPRPPYVYGNIEFNEGGNLLMEITDAAPGEVSVGDAMRFVFRVKDYDHARGFRRYFWKATKV
jgi:3-hydroxy-3-methylglutaryl CoA synthase